MSDTGRLTEEWSPKKRELLELLLKEKNSQAEKQKMTRQPDATPFRLSSAQQRLWFLEQFEPGSSAYNIPFARRVLGPLDLSAFERSLQEIVARHQPLRTVISTEQGQPVGRAVSGLPFAVDVLDLTAEPEAQRLDKARRIAAKEAARAFDLARGPLIRARVLRLGEADQVVLLTLHHIIADAWSLGVLLREMSLLYNAYTQGQPSPLPELTLQYSDYAEHQQDWLHSDACESQLSYWKQVLGDAPAALDLPMGRPSLSGDKAASAEHVFTVPATVYDRLKALSRQEACTLFMTLLAAYSTLLHRYTDQDDMVIGTPVANRERPEMETLIGFFVNTLALRVDLAGDPRFRDLMRRIRQAAIGAFSHQQAPFDRLVQELRPARERMRSPLFQTMFTVQNVPMPTLHLSGLSVQPFAYTGKAPMFDLAVTFRETGEQVSGQPTRLTGYLEYDTSLFDYESVQRMGRHLQRLLEQVALDADQTLSRLSLASEDEQQRQLSVWNHSYDEALIERAGCGFQAHFEQQVSRAPDAIAVCASGQQWSYAELNRRANRLAHHLRSLGVRPETRVGLCMERSFDYVLGLLAVIKAGGTFVPLDATLPSSRLRFIAGDAGLRLILTHPHWSQRLVEMEIPLVAVDADTSLYAQAPPDNPPVVTCPDHLAYVIYTSGTTGDPKGVAISHDALIHHALVIGQRYGLRAADRVLQFAALGFDVAVEELLPTWLAGAAVVLGTDAAITSFADFTKLIDRDRLTVLNLPASFFHSWVDWLSDTSTALPATLHGLVVGSEKVSSEKLAIWQHQAGDAVQIFNAYGLTETTITAAVYGPISSQSLAEKTALPIGEAIAASLTYVLDSQLQPVPTGVAGELYVGGKCLARGYLNRADQTGERFIPNPHGRDAGDRLYRTGDRCRYNAAGLLEFINRADAQVKIRGFRVEPAEIEAALNAHPSVKQSFVMMRKDKSNHERLVGYVVNRPPPPQAADLRAFLRERLPEYMIPPAFVFLEALPLTANGKIDRRALPEPERRSAHIEASYVAPRTELEKTISAIWQEVLQVDKVGIDDNFFDLGGHSLLMATILSRLQPALKQEITMVELFEYPTVGLLTRHLSREQTGQATAQQAAKSADKLKTGQSRLQQRFRQQRSTSKGR